MYLQTAATHTELWPIDKFVPYVRNPRKNDAAVDRMCGSLREFGFKIPCLVRSDGEVVDGHLRLKAARKLGIAEIPIILCDEWTPAQVKAFRLMVNRSVTWAAWDEELLALELQEIQESDLISASRDSIQTDPESIHLRVRDNGAGFETDGGRSKSGLGIISMKERIRLVHGTLELSSRPGQGTEIKASVPLTGGVR